MLRSVLLVATLDSAIEELVGGTTTEQNPYHRGDQRDVPSQLFSVPQESEGGFF
jgi:hypothetical protein